MQRIRKSALLLSLLVLLTAVAQPSPQTAARPLSGEPLDVRSGPAGVSIAWSGTLSEAADGAPSFAGWRSLRFSGYRLPAQLVAVRLPQTFEVPLIQLLESKRWGGTLPQAKPPVPRTAAGEVRADLQPHRPRELPHAPVFILRQARLRGVHVAVIAVSPLYKQQGEARAATRVEAYLPGAQLFDATGWSLSAGSDPFLAAAQPPTNDAAGRNAIKVVVDSEGAQRITGAALETAGLDLTAGVTPGNLRLWHKGSEVALEGRGTGDGRLDPGDELRFVAPPPGDRWNATDTYWLVQDQTPGLRMTSRSALPGAASLRDSALERGVWRDNTMYDSLLPGPDSDHWFARNLSTGFGLPPAAVSIPLTPTLPLVDSTPTVTVTVGGSAYTAGEHTITATMAADSAGFSWRGVGSFSRAVSLAANTTSLSLTLATRSAPEGVKIDSVAYERPVLLDFGGRGAHFAGVAGIWRYRLRNLPLQRTLYDITRRYQPAVLTIPEGSNIKFEDGPQARRYLLAGPGTLHEPELIAHTPVDLATPLDAAVLWIAPQAFHSALQPLVEHRRAQGHSVAVVDVQDIYDSWSYGATSPRAIRRFLQYAASAWSVAPAAVTLVGDGTSDPLNYLGRANPTHIPPYLAMVDPWLGETACDQCYAQLDGTDPVSAPNSDTLPDLAIGRFPVKSEPELEQLVAKLIDYESAPRRRVWQSLWQSRSLYLADNYRSAENVPDPAGDFAAAAESSIALQPDLLTIERLYYDPLASNDGSRWREPDAERAWERSLRLLGDGYALVNYFGHAHQWQYAVTDPAAGRYLFNLNDAKGLGNHGRPSIVLAMTCLTSAFQTPATSGNTVDEDLLLHADGGAAAVWGFSGLGVAYGHDLLQQGFYLKLWSLPPQSASLGSLMLAGYLKLYSDGACCQDTLRTSILLGDPLTPARVAPGDHHLLPAVLR